MTHTDTAPAASRTRRRAHSSCRLPVRQLGSTSLHLPIHVQGSKAVVRRAAELQEERRRANRRPLPLWVLPAILFFGWNELQALLRRPVLLIACFFATLFLYQLYKDLDVDGEMDKGLPSAALNIGRRLWPTSKRIVVNFGEAIKGFVAQKLHDHGAQNGASTPAQQQTPGTATPCGAQGTPRFVPGSAAASTPSMPGWTPLSNVNGGSQTPSNVSAGDVEMSPLLGGNGATSPVHGLRRRGDSDEAQSPVLGLATEPSKDK